MRLRPITTAAFAALLLPALGAAQERVGGGATRTIKLGGDGRFKVDGRGRLDGRVDAPAGTLELWVGGESIVRLEGKVGTVVLHLVDGKSVVDLGRLAAGRVVARGDVNGSSEVRLNAKAVDFRGAIDGGSRVDVAGAAVVTGKTINGGSRLTHDPGAKVTFASRDGGAVVEARTD